jgi:hypothetical protein
MWAYYQFAREQPQFFELMFVDRSVPQITDIERFSYLADMFRTAIASIAGCVEAGVFPAGLDPAAALHILWSAIHGAASLHLCQRLAEDENPDLLAADTLNVAIAGLQSGVRTSFVCGACRPSTSDSLSTPGATTHAS